MTGIQKGILRIPGVVIIALMLLPAGCGKESDSVFKETVVFQNSTEGYHTFRIPSVIVALDGTVLAFCEGRKAGRSDTGNIDIVLKRSYDDGKTWGTMGIIWMMGNMSAGIPVRLSIVIPALSGCC